MATDTRERILIKTAELFGRQGYTGTGLKEIATEASAPFGSIYHHFPGGKEQLGVEVIRTAGAMYSLLLPAVIGPDTDLIDGIREFFRLAGEHLEQSGWQDACPVATVALEVASVNEPLRLATSDVFEQWIEDGTRFLQEHGILEPTIARELATATIAALEGAFILARAGHTTEPLRVSGELVATSFQRALVAEPSAR